jgi:hypothetical protein
MKDAYEPIMPQLVAQSSCNTKALPVENNRAASFPSSSASTSSSSTSSQDVVMKRSNALAPNRNQRVVSAAEKLSSALGTTTKFAEEINQIGGQKRDRDLSSTQGGDRAQHNHMSKKPTRSQDIEDGELE